MKFLIVLATVIVVALACRDSRNDCYRLTSYCRSHPDWASKNCQRTCNLCPTIPACSDKSASCKSWKNLCRYNSYVRENCKATCGRCTPVQTTTRRPITNRPVTNGPSNGSCGKPKYSQSRVVGGKTANAHSWPWQIGLHQNGRFMCGGSVINDRWIVTAAHCVHRRNAYEFTVKLGDHDRRRNEGEQTIPVSQIITHERYGRLNNDIALLKLSRPVMFNNKVQPICLPRQGEEPAVGSKCYITGWGKMTHPGSSVNILQQLALTIQSKASCIRMNSKTTTITDQMLCAANTDVSANQSGCHGDSGGPFVCQNQDNSWTLHGAVSWGSPRCNIKEAYTVFAKVGQFRDWIEQKMR